MTTLALDLGTKTGWALATDPIVHGTLDLKVGRYESAGMRFIRFRRWLVDMYANSEVSHVVFEEVRAHRGVDAAHVYGGLMATLQAWCVNANVDYEAIPVGTIKRHVTGKGNANKDQVMRAVKALGYAIQDDNEADAVALLLCHQASVDGAS